MSEDISLQQSLCNFNKMLNVLKYAREEDFLYLTRNFDLTGNEGLNEALVIAAELKFR